MENYELIMHCINLNYVYYSNRVTIANTFSNLVILVHDENERTAVLISFCISQNLKFFENVSATVTRFELNFIYSKRDTVSLICITMCHGVR